MIYLFIYLLSPDKLKSSDEDLSVACVICEGVPNRVHEPAESLLRFWCISFLHYLDVIS